MVFEDGGECRTNKTTPQKKGYKIIKWHRIERKTWIKTCWLGYVDHNRKLTVEKFFRGLKN